MQLAKLFFVARGILIFNVFKSFKMDSLIIKESANGNWVRKKKKRYDVKFRVVYR